MKKNEKSVYGNNKATRKNISFYHSMVKIFMKKNKKW